MQEESTQSIQPEYTAADYDEAARFVLSQVSVQPRVGLVLGSGLSELANRIEDAHSIAYSMIPHCPVSTVPGHAGRLVLGRLAGVDVCVMQGRFHFYEGYSQQAITLPVRVMRRMGVEVLILTNAAGGLNPDFRAGDLMLIEDHVNFPGMAGHNPLRGPNLDEFGPRFPAANHIYTRRLRRIAERVAMAKAIPLQHGVYVMVAGPNFETPAEVRFLRQIGDAVGMSTVPEALVASHAGMEVLAISTITNVAIDAVDAEGAPSHEEVTETGHLIVPRLTQLLTGILEEISQSPDP